MQQVTQFTVQKKKNTDISICRVYSSLNYSVDMIFNILESDHWTFCFTSEEK